VNAHRPTQEPRRVLGSPRRDRVARKPELSQLILEELLRDEGDPDDDPIDLNDILMMFLIEVTTDNLDEPSERVREVQEGALFAGASPAADQPAMRPIERLLKSVATV
jgi:hypothetical protein